MGIVHVSEGKLPPASLCQKSEVAIVAGLAKASLPSEKARLVNWDALMENYDLIRDIIERVIPGFTSYNERVRQSGGFYLPNPVRDNLQFNTPVGKARFTVHPIPKSSLKADQYTMMTIRSHDQYNTTIYGLNDRYRGVKSGRRVLFMNSDDISAAGLKTGQKVDITSHFEGETRRAEQFVVVAYPIPRKSVAGYFPEANVLVPIEHKADKSHTPCSKSFVVTLDQC